MWDSSPGKNINGFIFHEIIYSLYPSPKQRCMWTILDRRFVYYKLLLIWIKHKYWKKTLKDTLFIEIYLKPLKIYRVLYRVGKREMFAQCNKCIEVGCHQCAPLPTSPNSFSLTCKFIKKSLLRGLAPLPSGLFPLQWEILDPPLHGTEQKVQIPLFWKAIVEQHDLYTLKAYSENNSRFMGLVFVIKNVSHFRYLKNKLLLVFPKTILLHMCD